MYYGHFKILLAILEPIEIRHLSEETSEFTQNFPNSMDIQAFFLEYFDDVEAVKGIDWEIWLYGTGMPPYKVCNCANFVY